MPILITEDEPGTTGKLSPGKIIAWFWMLADIWLSVVYFGFVQWTPVVELTFWKWLMGSFILGIISAGFYAGMAKGGFSAIVEALKKRIENAK